MTKPILVYILVLNYLYGGTIASNFSSSNKGVTSTVNVNLENSSVYGNVENIVKSIDNINRTLDGLFSTSNLTSLDAQLNQSSLIGSCLDIDYTSNFSGICDNLGDLGVKGLGDNDTFGFFRCTGMEIDALGNLGLDLTSLCNGEVARKVVSTGYSDKEVDEIPPDIPTSTGYTPIGISVAYTPELAAIGDGTLKNKGKSIKEVKFPSGKSGKELYSDGGGYFAKRTKDNPNSSDGRSWLEVDKTSLVLKEIALKNTGTSKENVIPLPKNLAEAIDGENNAAKLEIASFVSFNDIKNSISKTAVSLYKGIDADTVFSYMGQESKIFSDLIQTDERLKKAYKNIDSNIEMKYAREIFKEKHRGGHIYDPTQERLKYISQELKGEYVMSSLVQANHNTEIKVKMLKEKRLKKELMDITVERAFYSSSTFPSGTAEAEIEALLMAVDRSID